MLNSIQNSPAIQFENENNCAQEESSFSMNRTPQEVFTNVTGETMELLQESKIPLQDRKIMILRDPASGRVSACIASLGGQYLQAAITKGDGFKILKQIEDASSQKAFLENTRLDVHFGEVELMGKLRGGAAQIVDVLIVHTKELMELGLMDVQRQGHQFAQASGYAAGLITGDEHFGQRRLICFRDQYVTLEKPTSSDLESYHSSRHVAAKRWAVDKGYYSGWLSGETSGNRQEIICLNDIKNRYDKSIFQYLDISLDDLKKYPDPRYLDFFHGVAVDHGFMTGIWNHEQSGGRRGVILIPRLN